jgi:hypothetical protein
MDQARTAHNPIPVKFGQDVTGNTISWWAAEAYLIDCRSNLDPSHITPTRTTEDGSSLRGLQGIMCYPSVIKRQLKGGR